MFDVYCPRCRARVLLTTRRIVALENTDAGIFVTYRCWSGHEGLLVTGRSERRWCRGTEPPAA